MSGADLTNGAAKQPNADLREREREWDEYMHG